MKMRINIVSLRNNCVHLFEFNILYLIFVRIISQAIMRTDFSELLDGMQTISLDEMSAIRLMNRTDRKYLATEDQLLSLLQMVHSDYMVQEIGGKRYAAYHTTYLDNDQHVMYNLHHTGHLTRQKVRVRTYLDTDDTFFEIKLKNNHGRTTKKRIHIPSHDDMFSEECSRFLAGTAMLPVSLEEMKKCVENRFERITLVNNARTERLTIDTGLGFHNLETDDERQMDGLVVIEVKRDGNTYSPIVDMLRELRVFPSGFSKYCIGSALTNPELKRNRFNLRIRKVNKLMRK